MDWESVTFDILQLAVGGVLTILHDQKKKRRIFLFKWAKYEIAFYRSISCVQAQHEFMKKPSFLLQAGIEYGKLL